jgi:hypothetical protein
VLSRWSRRGIRIFRGVAEGGDGAQPMERVEECGRRVVVGGRWKLVSLSGVS